MNSTMESIENKDGWLTDNVFDFYIEKLQSLMNSYDLNNTIILSPSTMFLLFYLSNEELLSEQTSGVKELNLWYKVKERKKIFIVLNNSENLEIIGSGSHWSLLVIEKENKPTAIHYDSHRSSNKSIAYKITKRMETFLGQSIHYEEAKNAPQQNNAYDCGVHVLVLLDRFLNPNSKLDIYALDVCSRFRVFLSEMILSQQQQLEKSKQKEMSSVIDNIN